MEDDYNERWPKWSTTKMDLLKGLKHQKPNQNKPNKTSFLLYVKFSPISFPIELKFGMYAK